MNMLSSEWFSGSYKLEMSLTITTRRQPSVKILLTDSQATCYLTARYSKNFH